MPLKNRRLTSAVFRSNGKCILVDCGEGTQVAIKEAGFTFKPIDVLCITHFHADHISGLPGLLLSMGNEGREDTLTIIGPRGIEYVVNSLRIIAPGLPFDIRFIEVSEPETVIDISGFRITAFHVRHTVECLGYKFEIDRIGKFDVEKARMNNVPQCVWSTLQKNNSAEYNGVTYTSDMVLGQARKGIKVLYCTDTRPLPIISDHAQNADLFICEGMYGDQKKQERAEETCHMMFHEAAELAKQANADRLWLTHYSPSLEFPEEFIDKATDIFQNTIAASDGEKITIKFADQLI